jgi:DNA-binding MarR family transcriptional regulator
MYVHHRSQPTRFALVPTGWFYSTLARHSFVTPQTMNGIVTNLETAGLVVRRSHPEHGRVLQACLSEEGVGLVVRAHRVVEAIEERMLSDLGKEERRWLLDALRKCTDSLEAGPEKTAADMRTK